MIRAAGSTRLPILLLSSLLLVVIVTACAQEPELRSISRDLLSDPQVVALDYSSPSFRFDGLGGSLLPTEGWAPPEAGNQPKETPFFAWALRGKATLVFLRPPESEVDFFARARSFVWNEAPPQSATLQLNGRIVGRLWISSGWQTYRTRLPADAFVEGLNELTLEFAYSGRPSEITGGRDKRDLSCAFSDLALLPSNAPDPWALLDIPRFDAQHGVAELPVWGGLSIPLPGGADGRLRLGAIDTRCMDCRLVVETADGRGNPRQLWQGTLAQSSDREFTFRSPNTWAGFLGLRILPPERREIASDVKVLIGFPPDFLEIGESDRTPVTSPPPVILYMVDTLRADALEIYGAPEGSSPRLAEFAGRAVTYEEAWAPSAWTLPSVASLFTGLLPSRHRMGLADRKLPGAEMPVMARLLASKGYQTLGVSQSFVASAAFGLESGFERFLLSNQLNGQELRSAEIRRYLLTLLAAADVDRPPFVYLHSVDPHVPYLPRGEYRRFLGKTKGNLEETKYRPRPFMFEGFGTDPQEVAQLRARYQGEVLFTDHQFGRFVDLLAQLSLLDRSMIVFLSDHGEEFGEHGGFDHGRTVNQEMLRVPLLIQFPGRRWSGNDVEQRVSLLDVLPTILVEAGFDPIDGADGLPLHPDRLGDQPPRPIFAETNPKPAEDLGAVDLQAMAIEWTKCIHSSDGMDQFSRPVPEWRVFDLETDPLEQQPLESGHPVYQRCTDQLSTWLRARSEWSEVSAEPEQTVDEQDLETLRALGYIQ